MKSDRYAADDHEGSSKLHPFKLSRYSRTQGRPRFQKRHGEQDAAEFQNEAHKIAERLKHHRRWSQKLVLHPEKTKWLGRWDILTTLALVYTATITPFETAFLPAVLGTAAWADGWFILNRLLDLTFTLDMLLQFFIAYQQGTSLGGWTWIENHDSVIRHYLTTWFALDFSTVFVPGAFDIYLASSYFDRESGGDAASFADRMGMLRVLRVLRLVKLVRLVRASRLFKRWKSKITLSHGMQTILSCFCMLLFGAHWYACIIALDASLHRDVDETWVGANLYQLCDSAGPMAASGAGLSSSLSSPAPLKGCEALSVGGWYLAALSWSTMVITGTGARRGRHISARPQHLPI